MDWKTGFRQIRIAPQEIKKTAFKSKHNHFKFLVMPVGLRSAPATIQSLIYTIFYDCIDKFSVIFLDVILVLSSSLEEHTRYIMQVLDRLQKHKLCVRNSKFEALRIKTDFVGLQVGKIGLFVSDERERMISQCQNLQILLNWKVFLDYYDFSADLLKDFVA